MAEPMKGVESTTPKPEENTTKPKPNNKDKKKNEADELSEEDQKLKNDLDTMVERLSSPEEGVQNLSLELLRKEIKESTSSMTSVPKPLKFLRPHYDKLKELYQSHIHPNNKQRLADILSVLGMTMGTAGARECLKFKLEGDIKDPGSWGHEYVRHLAGEIAEEYTEKKGSLDGLTELVNEIIPFMMKHNGEHEACDLLYEVDQLARIESHVDEVNYSKVCSYLIPTAVYVDESEDATFYRVTLNIYKKVSKWADAMRVAIKLGDQEELKAIFNSTSDEAERKQLALMMARQGILLEDEADGEYSDILRNQNLSEYFLALGQDLDIMEPKTPEDIYKSSTDTNRTYSANVDSARQNLASTFVNAFVNAGFGRDKLVATDDGTKWMYKNKEHGMMSAAASLGMVLMWDVEGSLTQIDKYTQVADDYIKAGALLAVGIVNAGVRHSVDPAMWLGDTIDNKSPHIRIGSILGLGLAYNGSAREDISAQISPVLEDTGASMEVLGTAALALGMINVGTGNGDITGALLSILMEKDAAALSVTHSRYLALGLGLLYLGKQEMADVTLETLKTLTHPIGQYAHITVEACAYVGTGNVLKVQNFLSVCADHLQENNGFQAAAAFGIAMVAMGEDIGSEMAGRAYDHLLQYGEPVIRRAVPLALGLLNISNPKVTVMDLLSKLSHDSDEEVSYGAIFALGLIGAGTNNSRVANMLKALASYYYKEANHLFIVRIAQGLVFLGKGTLSLSPFHSDKLIMSPTAMAGLLTVFHSCLDFKGIILKNSHYMLYCLSSAMYPRMLMTFDENLKPLPVSVRVGQAVDTVGQAGKPKTITGFQTHNTPVLLGHGDRAELATDDYLPCTSVLEGFVILKKNPDAKPKEEDKNNKDKK